MEGAFMVCALVQIVRLWYVRWCRLCVYGMCVGADCAFVDMWISDEEIMTSFGEGLRSKFGWDPH